MTGGRVLPLRRRARILAIQALYEVDTTVHSTDQVLDALIESRPPRPQIVEFARWLVHGVLDNQQSLDEWIVKLAPAWPLSTLAPVDRAILRLAIYEITIGDETPPKSAINEAVELAKVFGSDSSPRFVNGVLGSVMAGLSNLRV